MSFLFIVCSIHSVKNTFANLSEKVDYVSIIIIFSNWLDLNAGLWGSIFSFVLTTICWFTTFGLHKVLLNICFTFKIFKIIYLNLLYSECCFYLS